MRACSIASIYCSEVSCIWGQSLSESVRKKDGYGGARLCIRLYRDVL